MCLILYCTIRTHGAADAETLGSLLFEWKPRRRARRTMIDWLYSLPETLLLIASALLMVGAGFRFCCRWCTGCPFADEQRITIVLHAGDAVHHDELERPSPRRSQVTARSSSSCADLGIDRSTGSTGCCPLWREDEVASWSICWPTRNRSSTTNSQATTAAAAAIRRALLAPLRADLRDRLPARRRPTTTMPKSWRSFDSIAETATPAYRRPRSHCPNPTGGRAVRQFLLLFISSTMQRSASARMCSQRRWR